MMGVPIRSYVTCMAKFSKKCPKLLLKLSRFQHAPHPTCDATRDAKNESQSCTSHLWNHAREVAAIKWAERERKHAQAAEWQPCTPISLFGGEKEPSCLA